MGKPVGEVRTRMAWGQCHHHGQVIGPAAIARAKFTMGMQYFKGEDGVDKSHETAVMLWRQAASHSAQAKHGLAICLFTGQGVQKNMQEAHNLFLQSAKQGLVESMLRVGACYDQGLGVEKCEGEANLWFRMAADKGSAVARAAIGVRHYKAARMQRGNILSGKEAVKWLELSVKQGCKQGLLYLGLCYGYGVGVKANRIRAFTLFLEAANQGQVQAQTKVGECYYYGLGVVKNRRVAVTWWIKARDHGSVLAREKLRMFTSEHGLNGRVVGLRDN
jgi:TPR repeat protein